MLSDDALLARAQRAILASFNRDEVRQLVYLRLQENFEAIAPSTTLNSQVLELLLWADRNGRFLELILALTAERPQNSELAKMATELQAPASTDQASKSNRAGGEPILSVRAHSATSGPETSEGISSNPQASSPAQYGKSEPAARQLGLEFIAAGIAGLLAYLISHLLQVPEPWASAALPLGLVVGGLVLVFLHLIRSWITTYSLVFLPLLLLSLGINLYLTAPEWQNFSQTSIHDFAPQVQPFSEEDPEVPSITAYLVTINENGKNSYRFHSNFPAGGAVDFAGFVFVFDKPQDFTQYKSVVVTIRFVDDGQVDFVLEGEQFSQREWIRLGSQVTYPSTVRVAVEQGIHHISIPIAYFGKMDLRQIRKVSFGVDRKFIVGQHQFTVEDISFVR